MERIKNWRVPFRAHVEVTEEDAILRDDIADRPARHLWGAGRVTLLGDAIHATTPNLGQGACQALEDAVVLADSLAATGGWRRFETTITSSEAWLYLASVQLMARRLARSAH